MTAELLNAANKGDLDAFNRLVLAHQGQVFNHAYRMLGNFDSAEDVTQETFIRAYRKMHQFRGGSFKSWILRIATNLAYDEMRFRHRHPVQPLEPLDEYGEENESPGWIRDPGPLPEDAVETIELREAVQSALNRLPAPFRTAISLVDIQEMSYIEAADVMGVSIGTVKSRVARGRSLLRDALTATGTLSGKMTVVSA